MNKKVVEVVEEEIERILLADFEAEDVTFEVLERKEQESEEENNSDDEDMAEEVVEEDGYDFGTYSLSVYLTKLRFGRCH